MAEPTPAPEGADEPPAAPPAPDAQISVAPAAPENLFESASAAETGSLLLNLGSYEGPLDVLLDLARTQKVDLREISILALAEQYLVFIAEAKRLRLDVAAEYLVMAAWLAYLKSRLLLPKPPEDDGPTGEEMAAHLAFQLERLRAMREAAQKLFERTQLGRDFFARGEPERRKVSTRVEYTADILDLLRAYARQKTRETFQPLHLERRAVVAVDEALLRLRGLLVGAPDWATLESFLPEEWRAEDHARSAVASSFAAVLELAKHGQLVIRQEAPFAPLLLRRRDAEIEAELGLDADAVRRAAQATAAALEAQARAEKRSAAPDAPSEDAETAPRPAEAAEVEQAGDEAPRAARGRDSGRPRRDRTRGDVA